MNNHRSVPCPAHSVAGSLAGIGALGLAVAVNAHRDGMARAAEARQTYASNLWHARLIRARSSASEALSVARAAVNRVHDLEGEIAALRLAVASRDNLIRRLSKNA